MECPQFTFHVFFLARVESTWQREEKEMIIQKQMKLLTTEGQMHLALGTSEESATVSRYHEALCDLATRCICQGLSLKAHSLELPNLK
jgi:hypothetical protein